MSISDPCRTGGICARGKTPSTIRTPGLVTQEVGEPEERGGVDAGTHLYLRMWATWRLSVIKVKMQKYMTRMGQNTGTSKTGMKAAKKASVMAFVALYLQGFFVCVCARGLATGRGQSEE